MEFSLVIELKLAIVDTSYFIGLTPAENFDAMNSHNSVQRRPSSFFMKGRTERRNACSWFGMNLQIQKSPL
jgi:hypothetical protein